MAKFYRYMSLEELFKLSWGLDIVGKSYFNARTSSEGICFLGEHTLFDTNGYDCENDCDIVYHNDFSALDCYRFLMGIVCPDVLVEFEADKNILEESFGVYADPFGDYYDTIVVTEYCTLMYNRDIMVPTRYTIGDSEGKFTQKSIWYNF